MDVDKLLRLQGMADHALDATPPDQQSAWRGLVGTYKLIREQLVDQVPEELGDEFWDLFPADIHTAKVESGNRIDSMLAEQTAASDARTRLASLSGWLGGCIEGAQRSERLRLEAEAYAERRVRNERG